MESKQILAVGILSIVMLTSAAPMSVSAKAKAKTPAKVTVTSVKRVSNTKTTVKWKKLKKNTSGYAVYVKAGSSKWRLTKKVGKKTASVTFATSPESKYQVKVRAYKNGKKVKKYYNKKSKKFVSKNAYKKLKKKNRTTKKVASVKWGKYSSTKTINAVFGNKINSPNGNFDKNEDAALTWDKVSGTKKYEVYYSDGGAYKLIDTISGDAYTDTHYNPTKTISYKVRPVNGAYTGSWSKVLSMRPQDISNSEGHHHDWKVSTTTEEKIVGYETKTEYHTFCRICGEDMTWYTKGLAEYAEKNGYTIDDDEYYDNEFYRAEEEHDKRDQEKYGKWGQNESRYVDVKVPIKKNITVNKYSCDCGAVRTGR